MHKFAAHAVTFSLALFTLQDGPPDKTTAIPAVRAAGPVKAAETAKEVSTGKPGGPAKGLAGTKAADAGQAPAKAADGAKTPAKATGAGQAAAPAKAAEAKPCEPVKPCSID
jgi:hypothetical protein